MEKDEFFLKGYNSALQQAEEDKYTEKPKVINWHKIIGWCDKNIKEYQQEINSGWQGHDLDLLNVQKMAWEEIKDGLQDFVQRKESVNPRTGKTMVVTDGKFISEKAYEDKAISDIKEYIGDLDEYFEDKVEAPKPPIGLMPEWLFKEHRLKQIHEAIERFLEGGRFVPQEWIDERFEIQEWLKTNKPNSTYIQIEVDEKLNVLSSKIIKQSEEDVLWDEVRKIIGIKKFGVNTLQRLKQFIIKRK